MSTPPVSDPHVISEAKKKASHLKNILKQYSPPVALSQCLDIIAKLEHERDWNTYSARLKRASEDGKDNPVDAYLKDTIPLIMSSAATHYLTAKVGTIEAGTRHGILGDEASKQVPITLEPMFVRGGVTFCRAFFEATLTAVRFGSDYFSLSVDFLFPEEAFSVASRLLCSDKVWPAEPRLARTDHERQPAYILTIRTTSVRDRANHGLNIFNDSGVQQSLEKGLDHFFRRYGRAARAYGALQGKWGNKKLLEAFEKALWKLNSEDPPFMAASATFYSTTIAGLRLDGEMTTHGPAIVGGDDSAAIGACSIIHIQEGPGGKGGYYIAKYGDDWQARISLEGFTEKDVARVTLEFGIPRTSEFETSFYNSPAFQGLCSWAERNPQYAKRICHTASGHLPDWYERVLSAKRPQVKPTNQDFLQAIEKEPLLMDHGIWCSTHRDRKKTAKENKEMLKQARQSFSSSGFREFSVCCEWLRGCLQRKTINRSYSSYTLKHMVESWARKSGVADYYVSNGAFIAAAIHSGFEYEPDFDSPNVRFGISKKSPAILAGRVQ